MVGFDALFPLFVWIGAILTKQHCVIVWLLLLLFIQFCCSYECFACRCYWCSCNGVNGIYVLVSCFHVSIEERTTGFVLPFLASSTLFPLLLFTWSFLHFAFRLFLIVYPVDLLTLVCKSFKSCLLLSLSPLFLSNSGRDALLVAFDAFESFFRLFLSAQPPSLSSPSCSHELCVWVDGWMVVWMCVCVERHLLIDCGFSGLWIMSCFGPFLFSACTPRSPPSSTASSSPSHSQALVYSICSEIQL